MRISDNNRCSMRNWARTVMGAWAQLRMPTKPILNVRTFLGVPQETIDAHAVLRRTNYINTGVQDCSFTVFWDSRRFYIDVEFCSYLYGLFIPTFSLNMNDPTNNVEHKALFRYLRTYVQIEEQKNTYENLFSVLINDVSSTTQFQTHLPAVKKLHMPICFNTTKRRAYIKNCSDIIEPKNLIEFNGELLTLLAVAPSRQHIQKLSNDFDAAFKFSVE